VSVIITNLLLHFMPLFCSSNIIALQQNGNCCNFAALLQQYRWFFSIMAAQ